MSGEGVCEGRNGNELNSQDQVPGMQEKSFSHVTSPKQQSSSDQLNKLELETK